CGEGAARAVRSGCARCRCTAAVAVVDAPPCTGGPRIVVRAVREAGTGGLIAMRIKPLELAIGLRYTRAKRRNGFISFISAASMLGIALGIVALITTISVMNGFEAELRTRILGMVAHATIAGAGEDL